MNLQTIVSEIVANEPDAREAKRKALEALTPEIRAALLDGIVSTAVSHAIAAARHKLRVDCRDMPIPAGSVAGMEAAASTFRGLLDSWYIGAKRLRDATASDLDAAIARYSDAIAGNRRNMMFLVAIRRHVGNGKVGDAVSEDEARSILHNVNKTAATGAA